MAEFFQFEADFVDSLRCIPMQVRYKLDTCGVKLKLDHWNHFNADLKQALVEKPCQTPDQVEAYRSFLQQQIVAQSGAPAGALPIDPQPAWHNRQHVPEAVQTKAAELQQQITPDQWAELQPLQRFALIKLSRSSHENSNFLPALKEFGLV